MTTSKKQASPTLTCTKDGPYVVKGLKRLVDATGVALQAKVTMALCRCGASKRKPFCDGTHTTVAFRDEKIPGRVRDRRDDYVGREITIHDNRGICSHAGYCTDGVPAVWRMRVEPWIDPNGASRDEIISTIKQCPSGALSYSVDGREHRDQQRDPEILAYQDGPYYVRGRVRLQDTSFQEGASLEHFALCRCGGSKNKPFCDGTHWYIDFRDPSHHSQATETELKWYRVAQPDAVGDGRVKTVIAGVKPVALVHHEGKLAALDNRCPHQGGPLGQGTIENGCLRCPWHGWDFEALTGRSMDGRADGVAAYECEVREGGVYVAVPEPIKHLRTVSDVMVETMVNWGVHDVFGMVGHSNLGLADALRRQEDAFKLKFFGVRHEGAAAFACAGYAKLTGRPAACLGIAGPGSTNLLTGLWDAKVDRAPVLALSGQVNTQVLGPGAFQEVDLLSAFSAVSRFSQTVLSDSKHAELMALALKTAIVERDVAHLIFPDEVQGMRAPDGAMPSGPAGRVDSDRITPPPASIDSAVDLIVRAERPVVIVGYGARRAMKEVVRLAETLGAPVVTTFKAKGQIADRHPLAGGVLGRSGTPIASWLMKEADLLLVLGASFSNHTGIDPAKPTVQVDFDRMALGKFHSVDVPVWGEIGVTSALLRERLPRKLSARDQRPAIAERWRLWRDEKARRLTEERDEGVSSIAVFTALTKQCPDDAVIAVDVGNNTYSFGRYFECREQSILMSGYLGSIGFAFPAAMGAWAAVGHERPVVSISGDGGFGQYMAEFTTAVKYGMNITHVLLNNSELGKISLEQRAGQWPVWKTSLHNPDFSRFAELCGGYGVRVSRSDQLEEALANAMGHDGPSLVEVMTDSALV